MLNSGEVETVGGWLYQGGGFNAAPPSIGNVPTVSDLWLAEHRPIPGQPSSTALWNEMNTLRAGAGTGLTAAEIATVLGRVSLVATAGMVGWQIGSALYGHYAYQAADIPGVNYTGTRQVAAPGSLLGYGPGTSTVEVRVPAGRIFVNYGANRTFCENPSATDGSPGANVAPTGLPAGATYVESVSVAGACTIWDPSGSYKTYTGPGTKRYYGGYVNIRPPRLATGTAGGQPSTGPGSAGTDSASAYGGPYGAADAPAGSTYIDGGTVTPKAPPGGATVTTYVNTTLNTPDGHVNFPATWTTILTGSPAGGSSTTTAPFVPDPPPTYTTPNCSGMTFEQCVAAYQAAGATVTPTKVELDFNGAELTKPGGAVVTTTPAPGTNVVPGTAVVITVNPDPLPVEVPAPLPGETPDQYRSRLAGLGLTTTTVVLPDGSPDPSVGPGEVVRPRTYPRPGSRVRPGTSVTVTVNPDSAPDPTPPDPPGPNPPGIDLGPLRAAEPCSVFPMGVPCWVVDAAQQLNGAARAPVFHWHLPGGAIYGGDVTVDLTSWSTARDIVHPVLLLAFTIALGVGLFSMSGFGSAAPATKD